MTKVKNSLFSFFLLFLSALIFGLNSSIFSWIVFVPLLYLVHIVDFKWCWLYGGIYGVLASSFFVFWLITYNFPAMVGVWIIFFIYCSILFFLLKIVDLYFPKISILCNFILLMLYQFVQTLGFTGFNYGVIGYSQYKNLLMIQTSSFFGVWGITGIMILFSCLVYKILIDKKIKSFSTIIGISLEAVFILSSLIYGAISIKSVKNRDKNCKTISICAVQNNSDPWINGLSSYWNDLNTLIELTDKALKENPDIKIVVWPETAIVPSIKKAFYLKNDMARTNYVQNLLEYIESKDCAFLIGNFNVDLQNGNEYNSAFFFIPKENVIPPEPIEYSKIHLVPFAEYFPWKKAFPHIYEKLLDGDSQLWTPGKERVVFNYNGFRFSSPICFEDNFGSECKLFVKNGAKAFLNLSNDAWSKSSRCRTQHLQMAVFRSVENKIPTVRSTVDGVTCYINSYGKIESRCKVKTQNYICVKIPVIE